MANITIYTNHVEKMQSFANQVEAQYNVNVAVAEPWNGTTYTACDYDHHYTTDDELIDILCKVDELEEKWTDEEKQNEALEEEYWDNY